MTAPFPPGEGPGGGGSTGTTTTSTGVNVVTSSWSGEWVLPVPGGEWSSGSFMPNSHNHRDRTHPGLDIYAAEGSMIQAPVSGKVIATGTTGIGGNWVQIQGDDGYVYYFAHMQYPTHLQEGQQVSAGGQIGLVGNTGSASSTSPHLHFTVKTHSGDVVDPRPLMENGVEMATGSNGTQSGPTNVPTGGTLYEVDGIQVVVFEIVGTQGATAKVAYTLQNGATYPGQPIKVSRAEWNAMGLIDGGSSEAFSGLDAGTSWGEIMERTLYEMGIYGSDALSDPTVLAVIAEFVARPDMSPDELQGRLQQTDWWANHTEKQNSWNDKSPAQQDLEVVDAASQLAGVWFTYTGQNINLADFDTNGDGKVTGEEIKAGNPDLYKYAMDIASGAATQPSVINTWVKDEAEKDPESPWSRTLRTEEQNRGQFQVDVEAQAGKIMDLYQSYGIDMDWDTAMSMGRDVEMNRVSYDEVVNQVDEMAMALYPTKPKGMSTRQWAQPYTQTMMSVLEVGDPDLNDASLQKALSEGMTLGDFRKQLKSEDRWLETKNARDEFHSRLSGLGNQMGF